MIKSKECFFFRGFPDVHATLSSTPMLGASSKDCSEVRADTRTTPAPLDSVVKYMSRAADGLFRTSNNIYTEI